MFKNLFFMVLVLASVQVHANTQLKSLEFISGCWQGDLYGQTVFENWGKSHGGVMLGASKAVLNDQTESFEFLKVESKADGVYYTPFLNGNQALTFKLIEQSEQKIVFYNAKNDFPNSIEYKAVDNGLQITLRGDNSPESLEYTLSSVACK